MLPRHAQIRTALPFPRPRPTGRTRAALTAAVAVLLALPLLPPTAPGAAAARPEQHPAPATDPPVPLRSDDVSYPNGALILHGTVIAPVPSGRRPALVLVAGAGARDRNAYRSEAEAFARAGIVTLVYDKRPGYSRATSSFDQLATDALAGVRLLHARPDVDPRLIGVWGHSEGGWVAPLAAALSGDVGFVVTVGASGLSTDRTQLWSDRTHLAHAGVRPELLDPIGVNASRILIAAHLFGDVGHDPGATLERVRQPLLAVFAENDRSTPPGESLRLFRERLDRGGNRHYALRVVAGADHLMRRSADGFHPTPSAPFATGYLALTTAWIDGLSAGSPPVQVDPAPPQQLASAPTVPTGWFESPPVQVTMLVLILFGFAAYPVCATVRRARALHGRRAPLPARRPCRVAAAAGTACVLGTVGYVLMIVATGATATRTSVAGRPPEWLVLQLLAVSALAAAVTAATSWWRSARRSAGAGTAGTRAPGRPGGLVQATLLAVSMVTFLPWAAYWGLVTI